MGLILVGPVLDPTPINVNVTLPANVNQVDETGLVSALLSDAAEPGQVRLGAIIVSGGVDDLFLTAAVAEIWVPWFEAHRELCL